MRLLVLASLAGALPFLWGWVVHWLMGRFWPAPNGARGSNGQRESVGPSPFDYQI